MELEEAGPDNLLVETYIVIKYNTQVLSMWSDVSGKVIKVLGSNNLSCSH